MPVPDHSLSKGEMQAIGEPSAPRMPNLEVVQTSPSTAALLSLTQDITALISLSLEATASLVHDWFRLSLSTFGAASGSVVAYRPPPARPKARGESGRGLAVVVVGAGEATGQSLSLQLAKSGYTVFPFLPLQTSTAPPTSAALSSLLLTWSATQKRLRARNPSHPGAIVPIIIDSEPTSPPWIRELKARQRFRHAGETVRVYLRENRLRLVAVVCAAQSDISRLAVAQPEYEGSTDDDGGHGSDVMSVDGMGDTFIEDTATHAVPVTTRVQQIRERERSLSPATTTSSMSQQSSAQSQRSTSPILAMRRSDRLAVTLPHPTAGLLGTDETTLLSLYTANVVDPLTVIRQLRDLLTAPDAGSGSKGRVVFVNASSLGGAAPNGMDRMNSETGDGAGTVLRMVGAARSEAARLLREEMNETGVDVCEVVVGPMMPRLAPTPHHLRYVSDASSDGFTRSRVDETLAANHDQTYTDALVEAESATSSTSTASSSERILAARLALLTRLWAVDDALLYSSVRRAIEDRYPRYRHHAGLSPLVDSVVEMVPGAGLAKMVGRWVLGRLLAPRGS